MIILGVCYDLNNINNYYILFRFASSVLTTSNTNYTTPSTGYDNLRIAYSTNGGLSYNNTSLEVSLTLVNTGSESITCLYGSIFAYNNIVYVLYSNITGKLFLSKLTFNTGTSTLSFTNTQYIQNTSVSATCITAGEGQTLGRHVLDYSINTNNELILHILYHGALTTVNYNLNKVYYYL